jgi:hypothetical protein
MNLLESFEDGEKHEIDEQFYCYFLGGLPPVLYDFDYGDDRWQFGFCEGEDYVYGFKKAGGRYFAQKTDILNPNIYGAPEKQAHRPLIAAGRKWRADWLRIGRQNPSIRSANNPPFTLNSFHECRSVNELIEQFRHGRWPLGQAFSLGDLCFIQQADGGDEWLTIRQDRAFESINFGRIIAQHGDDHARKMLDQLRAASVAKCRELDS